MNDGGCMMVNAGWGQSKYESLVFIRIIPC